ncbi:hypothetical protein OH76DRAFT_721447 [Lentinus brumalis]|uniref:Uncharacterized protein n=1 Tax=Lentinus brumalis TaxID=2498619 RepID=A0A371D4Y4_9APHY|nr:hypothetical protein OH76DRAFT_721447 [Polyporus brumalis]
MRVSVDVRTFMCANEERRRSSAHALHADNQQREQQRPLAGRHGQLRTQIATCHPLYVRVRCTCSALCFRFRFPTTSSMRARPPRGYVASNSPRELPESTGAAPSIDGHWQHKRAAIRKPTDAMKKSKSKKGRRDEGDDGLDDGNKYTE